MATRSLRSKKAEEESVLLKGDKILVKVGKSEIGGITDCLKDHSNYKYDSSRASLRRWESKNKKVGLEVVPFPGEGKIWLYSLGKEITWERGKRFENLLEEMEKDYKEKKYLNRSSKLEEELKKDPLLRFNKKGQLQFDHVFLKKLYDKYKGELVDQLSREFGLKSNKAETINLLFKYSKLRFPHSPYKTKKDLVSKLIEAGFDEREAKKIGKALVGLYKRRFRSEEAGKEAIIHYIEENPEADRGEIESFFQTHLYPWSESMKEVREEANVEVSLRGRNKKALRKKALKMLKEGHTVYEVANKLNFKPETLWKNAREAYREAGVPIPKESSLKKDEEKIKRRIKELREEHPSWGIFNIEKRLNIDLESYLSDKEIEKIKLKSKAERKKRTKKFKLLKKVLGNPGRETGGYYGIINKRALQFYLYNFEKKGVLEQENGKWYPKDLKKLSEAYIIALKKEGLI